MSTLQVALAIAGGVVLAGVVAHSAWTSRKSKPRQADPTADRLEPREPGQPDQDNAASEPRFSDELQAQRDTFGAVDPLPGESFDVGSVMPAADKRHCSTG